MYINNRIWSRNNEIIAPKSAYPFSSYPTMPTRNNCITNCAFFCLRYCCHRTIKTKCRTVFFFLLFRRVQFSIIVNAANKKLNLAIVERKKVNPKGGVRRPSRNGSEKKNRKYLQPRRYNNIQNVGKFSNGKILITTELSGSRSDCIGKKKRKKRYKRASQLRNVLL